MKIEIINGDITRVVCGAIVNSANPGLRVGGGVSGAVHRAAGPEMAAECEEIGWCHTGYAVASRGHSLPSPYCIHAVGPVWRGGDHGEAILLKSAYQESLKLADALNVKTIAFPLISAGIYQYPLIDACYIAIKSMVEFEDAMALNAQRDTTVETVYIVVMDVRIEATLRQLLQTFNFDHG